MEIDDLLGEKITIYREKRRGRRIVGKYYTGVLSRRDRTLFFRHQPRYYVNTGKRVVKLRSPEKIYLSDGTFFEFI
jgi:hypothetical protein